MTDTLTIKVELPEERRQTGRLTLISPLTGLPIAGPFPVLGRAARNTAAQHGNANGDSVLPYGDTPLGGYRIKRIISNGEGTTRPEEVYGSAGSIVMDPASGDAETAEENGRTGLLIHAGRQPASPTPLPSHLKVTNGCLRMLNGDLVNLIDAIRQNEFMFPGAVTIDVTAEGGPEGDIDDNVQEVDPPPVGTGTVILP